MAGDDPRPTSELSAQINQRSLNAMPGAGSSSGGAGVGVASPYFAPAHHVSSADQLQPIRRHNLTLQQQDPPRVLVPPSSPAAMAQSLALPQAQAQAPGGFIPNGNGPAPAASFFAPPTKVATPRAGQWQPTNAPPDPSNGNSNALDGYLNGGGTTTRDSPPAKQRLVRFGDLEQPPSAPAQGYSSPFNVSNGSAALGESLDHVHLATSRPASVQPGLPPGLQSLPETDPPSSSSPVVGGAGPRSRPLNGAPRRIAEDDESQSQTAPPPAKNTPDYELAFIGFSNQFPQVDEPQKRKIFDQANGDVTRAKSAVIAATNPMMALMGQAMPSAAASSSAAAASGSMAAQASPTIIARSQATPGAQQSPYLQTQSPRPAQAYPYGSPAPSAAMQNMANQLNVFRNMLAAPGTSQSQKEQIALQMKQLSYMAQMQQQREQQQQQRQQQQMQMQGPSPTQQQPQQAQQAHQQQQQMMQHQRQQSGTPQQQQQRQQLPQQQGAHGFHPQPGVVQTRVVPAGATASIAPPQRPNIQQLIAQLRASRYPESSIQQVAEQTELKYRQALAEWQSRYGALWQQHQLSQQQHQLQLQQQQQAQLARPLQPAVPKTQVSQLVAAHRPQGPPASAGYGGKRKRSGRDYSDSDSGGNYSGESDNYDERANEAREFEALGFFNTCKVTDLPDYTACSLDAAKSIIELRPFSSPDDIRNKLKRTKGVSNKLFDSLVDVLEAYLEVDRVFNKCEEVSRQLSSTMRIWGGQQAPPPKPEFVVEDGARGASPDIDTGVNLIELDQAALDQSAGEAAADELKAAFDGYLREKPAGMSETIVLKGYQMLGINWINLLYSKGLSCILADEMGLGKTVQVIAFLSHLVATKKVGPHLVIVPSSTLDNWLREFDVFAPDLKVYSYYGTQGVRHDLRADLKAASDINVIVTTYNMATGTPEDRKFLRKMEFRTCTYDEGHQLKNSESKKYKDLMEIRVPWRLLLTGTPLQNNLTELISLLSFILPKVFGQADESLKAIFKVPPEAQANLLSRRRIQNAKRIMMPFVLRRKKLQVLRDLPQKVERIEYCEMTPRQLALYTERLENSKRTILQGEDTPTPASTRADTPQTEEPPEDEEDEAPKAKRARKKKAPPKKKPLPKIISDLKPEVNTSNVLMDLRKAANHPMLFRRLYDDDTIRQMSNDCLKELEMANKSPQYIFEDMTIMTDFELHRFSQKYQHLHKWALTGQEWMDAGKVNWLQENLPAMRERGDRVLLFSQFTMVLEMLEVVLDTMGIRYLKLTGQTNVSERQGMVDEYYADPDITVFLLSTRAGGLGLNLAAANVVIIYDMDFNPHNDKQAEDRAWRIGQTRDVIVIRLIVKDTIDEDMFNLANTKLTLDSEVSKIEQDAISRSASGTATPVEGEPPPDAVTVIAEKKAKQSILKSLRAKLEKQDLSASQSQQMSRSTSGQSMAEGAYLQTPASGPVVGAQEIKQELQQPDP